MHSIYQAMRKVFSEFKIHDEMQTEIVPVIVEKPEHSWSRRKIHTPTSLKSELNDSSKLKTTVLNCDNHPIPENRKRTATLTRRKTFHGQIPVESRYAAPRFRRPRRSISDDSTLSSTSSLASSWDDKGQYQEALRKLAHDDRWKKEVSLGTRVGFYRLYRDVGKGNFSRVKMGVHYLTKDKVAMKIIDKTKLQVKNIQMLSKEVSTMEAVQHPHIIRLYEVIDTPYKLFLAMEYAEGGELFHRVANGGRMPETQAKIVFAQLTSAVIHLHKQNIIHRDLKPENVFMAAKGVIKVGDFGFSTRIQSSKEVLLTFCGSPPYVAPEIFQNENYIGPSVDLWSMGVILYFIVTAALPFKGDTVSIIKRKILNGQFSIPKFLSKECVDLINGLLQLDPQKRLSTNHIKCCSWLKDVKFPVAALERNVKEKDVRNILEKMGISDKMLKEHKEKGAKSCIMGTYRILIHKCEEKYISEDIDKNAKRIVISCPTFESKTCTIL